MLNATQRNAMKILFRSVYSVSTSYLRDRGISVTDLVRLRNQGLVVLNGDRWIISELGVLQYAGRIA
jgi:hypothetical protein